MEGIYGQDSPAVAVVVYGNRDYDDALLELRDWCVAHGFVPVAGAAFIGEHSYSRPDRPIAGGRPDNPDLHKPGAGQSWLCLRKWLVPHTVGHKDDFRS